MKRLCKIVACDAIVAHKNVTYISIYNSGNRFYLNIRFFHSICPSRHSTNYSLCKITYKKLGQAQMQKSELYLYFHQMLSTVPIKTGILLSLSISKKINGRSNLIVSLVSSSTLTRFSTIFESLLIPEALTVISGLIS